MRLLLEKDAKPSSGERVGSTALLDAAGNRNARCCYDCLLDKGAEASHRTKMNSPCSSIAAMYGSEEMVKLLLDRGAQVNVQDERGYSPLMYAAYSEDMPAGIVRHVACQGRRHECHR